MMNKTVIISIIAALVALLSTAVGLLKDTTEISFGAINEQVNTLVAKNGVAFTTKATGGGVLRGDGMKMTASTSPCFLLSPAATSTLNMLLVYLDKNATTTAREVSIATSTVRYATTSPILDGSLMTVTGNSKWVLQLSGASTTPASVNSKFAVLPPNTYINVSFKGGTPGSPNIGNASSTELGGSCAATFLSEGL